MTNFLLNVWGMSNVFNFLDVDYCGALKPVVKILHSVVTLIQWGVPLMLILFGMIDLGKAVMSSKEDEMKKAQNTLIKRVIYAVAVFLVITLVSFVMGVVGDADPDDVNTTSWSNCWKTVS